MADVKFGAVIPVLNEWRLLPAVAGQLLKVCDHVLVTRTIRAFSGAPVELTRVPKLDPRIEVVHVLTDEGGTRNLGIEYLAAAYGCEQIFTLDSDEVFLDEELYRVRDLAARGHRAVACYLKTYWKTPRFEIQPPDRIPAVVCVRKDTRFRFMRVLEGDAHVMKDGTHLHHLSYVRTDEEVKEKIRLYGHAHQINQEWWFERSWRGWDQNNDLENLHPVNPASFKKAVPALEPRLEAVLKENGVDVWW